MTEPNDPIVTTPTVAAQAPAPDGAVTPDHVAAPDGAATPDHVATLDHSAATLDHSAATLDHSAATLDPAAERHVASTIDNGGHGQGGTPFQSGAPGNGVPSQNGDQDRGTTAAQLRRFIKSRAYVPMHELRRRFELNGECDDVLAIETPDGRAYIGLPEREGRFMADLVRQGEVGLELGHDPEVAVVVGVFPMRPVGR